MLTSVLPWLLLADERRTGDDGITRTWTTIGNGDVTKRVKVEERPRWGRWSFAAWKARQQRALAVAEFIRQMRVERDNA